MDMQTLRGKFLSLRRALNSGIYGYERQLDRLLQCLLMGGHVLEEGVPGVGKTLKMKYLGKMLACQFQRIQFTPDTDPSSIVGYMAADGYKPGDMTRGAQLVLGDEINRGTAEVQSATLEAMAEGQVTIEGRTITMPDFFLFVATCNPIESDGVTEVPHAQKDRFAVKLYYPQPTGDALKQILRATALHADLTGMDLCPSGVMSVDEVLGIRRHIYGGGVECPEAVYDYQVRLQDATSPDETINPNKKLAKKLAEKIKFGLGPRGGQWMVRLAAARAWMNERNVITGPDIRDVMTDCMRCRLVLADDAEEGDVSAEDIVQMVTAEVPALTS